MASLLILAALFGLMYVALILPQQRRARAQSALLQSLEEGDEVMTTSGIYGVVIELDDESLLLEVAPGVELRMARGAVGRRIPPAITGAESTPSGAHDDLDDEADDPDAPDDVVEPTDVVDHERIDDEHPPTGDDRPSTDGGR